MGVFIGKFRGIVVDVNDPDKRGRIRVLCPKVLGKTNISNWALPCLPPNQFTLPKKDDLVWMEFEDGDRDIPIWIGIFYTRAQFKSKFGNLYSTDETILNPVGNVTINTGVVTISSDNVDISSSEDVSVVTGGNFNTTTGGINNLN